MPGGRDEPHLVGQLVVDLDRVEYTGIDNLALRFRLGYLQGGRDEEFGEKQNAWKAEVRGDARIAEISAASILAKTDRDAWMCRAAQVYPGYGFERHKGYPTPSHVQALARLGPCPLHRRSFAPVRSLLPFPTPAPD